MAQRSKRATTAACGMQALAVPGYAEQHRPLSESLPDLMWRLTQGV